MLVSLRLMIIPFCELNSMMRNYLIEMSHKQRNKENLAIFLWDNYDDSNSTQSTFISL